MRAEIYIEGGINGNYTILSKLNLYSDYKKGSFNAIIVKYDTITDAKKDLKNVYKKLKEEKKYENSEVHLSFSTSSLRYDASSAEITF